MAFSSESISRKEACGLLRIGRRRLRDLLREGTLTAADDGYNRRVTALSLDNEIKRRGMMTLSEPKSGNCWKPLPTIIGQTIDIPMSRFETKSMYVNASENQTIGELLPLSRAAAEIGVGDSVMKKLVETGQLPSIAVGTRRRVNREVLRSWARGELAQPAAQS